MVLIAQVGRCIEGTRKIADWWRGDNAGRVNDFDLELPTKDPRPRVVGPCQQNRSEVSVSQDAIFFILQSRVPNGWVHVNRLSICAFVTTSAAGVSKKISNSNTRKLPAPYVARSECHADKVNGRGDPALCLVCHTANVVNEHFNHSLHHNAPNMLQSTASSSRNARTTSPYNIPYESLSLQRQRVVGPRSFVSTAAIGIVAENWPGDARIGLTGIDRRDVDHQSGG